MPGVINISAYVSLTVEDGSKIPFASGAIAVTQSGDGVNASIQDIGTSAEALTLGEVTTESYAYFKNLDDTNYVEIGWDASGFQSALKLLPGQFAVAPLNSARTWQAQANTAAVKLYSVIFQA